MENVNRTQAVDQDTINQWFTPHNLTKEGQEGTNAVNAAAKALAQAINRYCPEGSDKLVAFRLLRQSVSTATASITLQATGIYEKESSLVGA